MKPHSNLSTTSYERSFKLEGMEEFEELLEARETELQAFEPSPRETEADRNDDRRSLNRRLDRMLYLLVKKPRREHAWQMPQGEVEVEESLLEVSTLVNFPSNITLQNHCISFVCFSYCSERVVV